MARKIYLAALAALLAACNANIDEQPAPSVGVVKSVDSISVITPGQDITEDTVRETPADVRAKDTVIIREVEAPVFVYVSPDSLVSSIYFSQVGVRELTGNNDGPHVERYLRAVGLGKGYAWCSAFVRWVFDSAKIATPITAWSPTAENPKNFIYKNGKWLKEVQRGDVFTLYFPRLKRIGHTGFVEKKFGINSVQTVEGNTNSAGSREGDGVYIKVRPKESVFSISRWL